MTQRPDPAVAAAITRERRLLDAVVRRSALDLEELLDPEFREVGASGRTWTRASIVEALVTDEVVPTPIRDEAMEGRRLAEHLVLLTYVSDAAGRRAHRTSLWRRDQTGWRLLHHQGTLVAG